MSSTTAVLQDDEFGALEQYHSRNLAKSRRPYNSAYTQQNLPTWVPIMTPKLAVIVYFSVGAVCAILGAVLFAKAEDVREVVSIYSNQCGSQAICTLRVDVPKDLGPEVFIYYGLTNYYSNYRRYVKSVDYSQLSGGAQLPTTPCAPLATESTSGLPIAPCGLIANSFFNDTLDSLIDPSGRSLPLNAEDIAWQSDIGKKFKNPLGWEGTVRPPYWQMDIANLSTPAGYGYENQDFVNWMRTMALPAFRKLWRKTTALAAGTYTFTIINNYPVASFGGRKELILSTSTWLGGKNCSLGVIFLGIGALYCIFALLFLLRQNMKPRRLGDPQYLRWNHERRALSR